MPGKKNDSGETLWVELIPLHPVPSNIIIAGTIANRKMQFNLTVAQYMRESYVSNH